MSEVAFQQSFTDTRNVRSDRNQARRRTVGAARSSDLGAIRALADWYRERGLPGSADDCEHSDQELAYQLESLAFEFEERNVQARKLRRLLELLPQDQGGFGSTRYATEEELRRHAQEYGLPLEIHAARRVGMAYRGEGVSRTPTQTCT